MDDLLTNSDEPNSEVRKIQLALLRMLKNVDAICQKHAIGYWLDGGTLLGAVRHKGFIPWDDDLDIVMPREDYERFVRIAPAELHEDLFLQTLDTDPTYDIFQVPCKIKEKSILDLEREAHLDGSKEIGIFLDIIPIDKYRKSGFGYYVDYLTKYTFRRLCGINASYLKNGSGFKLRVNNFLARYKGFIRSRQLVRAYKNLLKKKIQKSKTLKTNYLVGYAYDSLWIRLFKVEDIYPLGRVKFEDGEFPAPANCDGVLRTFYGDYMKLPPKSKRIPQHQVTLDSALRSRQAQKVRRQER